MNGNNFLQFNPSKKQKPKKLGLYLNKSKKHLCIFCKYSYFFIFSNLGLSLDAVYC